jgi:branched-chain amino acid transport system substrate-binding protein
VAADAIKRTTDLNDRQSLVDAIKKTKLATIVGPLDWTNGPVPNVAKTPLVGGQWRKGSQFPYDLVIVNNTHAPMIPTGGSITPIATGA